MELPTLERSAAAHLPTRYGRFRAIAYTDAITHKEHLALLAGVDQSPPLVRLHSECLTGDTLGSLRCDCGPQLERALRQIAAAGGILLYLRQEGRGIGLLNKIRAYALQDDGFDTLDANLHLGFGADERDYAVAAAILHDLAAPVVRLLTNNPQKVAGLRQHGIEVTQTVPLVVPANAHNIDYLRTKRDRMQHHLPGLNGELPHE